MIEMTSRAAGILAWQNMFLKIDGCVCKIFYRPEPRAAKRWVADLELRHCKIKGRLYRVRLFNAFLRYIPIPATFHNMSDLCVSNRFSVGIFDIIIAFRVQVCRDPNFIVCFKPCPRSLIHCFFTGANRIIVEKLIDDQIVFVSFLCGLSTILNLLSFKTPWSVPAEIFTFLGPPF